MSWRISGSYFESCSCEAICPCRSIGGRPGGRSTYGVCEFALSWLIESGHFGDVDLRGRAAVLAGFYSDDEPGSPWTAVLYVDARADDAQLDALADIFLGRAGGTSLRNYAAAIVNVVAVRRASIELEHDDPQRRISVRDHVEVTASDRVPSDEAVACGIPGLDHPGQELRASIMRVRDDPLSWEYRGRCAFTTDFEYSSAT